MMTPNEVMRRWAQLAMESHNLTEPDLARALGCSRVSVGRIMEETPVRLTQEQWFNLYSLSRVKKGGR